MEQSTGGKGGMRGSVRVHFDLARQKPKIGRSGYLLVKRVSRNATRRRPGKRVITVSRLVKCRVYIDLTRTVPRDTHQEKITFFLMTT